ncbi:hypothetical protein [Nocardia sp. NBC_01327]|uniref:hypothetical protein n=1 Tax=Nocardia sp. NBC_01327 TaxID=2903593 RepID=UPI002E127C4C|nr:hypothetical protein OG326_38835 [Nocardia sp. NBC_01327]
MRTLAIGTGIAVGIGVACTLLGAGSARAETFSPDYSQVANGAGYGQDQLLTPGYSPIQVPRAEVRDGKDGTTVVAHPFIAPWVHQVIPVAPGTAVELRGAARVQIPGAAALAGGGAPGRSLVINPNGHCVFAGPDTDPATLDATALAPIRVDVPFFDLVIEPTLYR